MFKTKAEHSREMYMSRIENSWRDCSTITMLDFLPAPSVDQVDLNTSSIRVDLLIKSGRYTFRLHLACRGTRNPSRNMRACVNPSHNTLMISGQILTRSISPAVKSLTTLDVYRTQTSIPRRTNLLKEFCTRLQQSAQSLIML